MEVGGDDLPKRKETKELHVWSVNGEPGMVITWTISIHERILREGNNGVLGQEGRLVTAALG